MSEKGVGIKQLKKKYHLADTVNNMVIFRGKGAGKRLKRAKEEQMVEERDLTLSPEFMLCNVSVQMVCSELYV